MIIVDVLFIESEVNKNRNTKQSVVEDVKWVGVVKTPRKSIFGQIIEDDEGNYYILKPKEDKEVRESIVKPSSMVQN
jgi:hypothetical protein